MKMYDLQNSLPKLPLPLLESSCDKLLEWSQPLLSEADYYSSKRTIERFQSSEGLGPILQKLLNEWYLPEDVPNWLEPFWFDTYLKNRLPLPINSNVAFVLEKNQAVRHIPRDAFVASLIISLAQYQQILLNEALDIDYQGTTPLCMSQYKTILGTTRIPERERDDLQTVPDTHQIVIISKGHGYVLNFLEENGEIAEYANFLNSIRLILNNSNQVNSHALGSLTTLNRAHWAGLRQELITIDPINRQSIESIETALAVIVIDDQEYENDSEMFKSMLCGDSDNRWYDKSLQFIVNKDHFAVNYEHSGVDGTTLGNLVRYLYKNMETYEDIGMTDEEYHINELALVLDDSIESAIDQAKALSRAAQDNLVVQTLPFNKFGKDHIKSLKISPDSFVQMGIQLAQYKAFGEIHNTYEAVMTKQFLKGRTEAMRPVTKESIRFAHEPSRDNLSMASKKHIERIIECKNGQGIDRHFYGLRKMHEIHFPNDELPEIFNSPSYQSITRNAISTSTSNPLGVIYAGYGPSIEDGYAVRYLIDKNHLNFVLSCKSHKESTLQKLKEALEEALMDMADILSD